MINVTFCPDCVKVTFNVNTPVELLDPRGPKYDFKLLKSHIGKVQVGDLVVVKCTNGFQLVRVVQTGVHNPSATAYVVDLVNTTEYDTLLAKQKEAKILREKLEAKKKAFEEVQLYEMLAKEDSEARELLAALKDVEADI